MLFQYLHKMRCKITKKNPYMQEQNACHVIFPVILADSTGPLSEEGIKICTIPKKCPCGAHAWQGPDIKIL